jgi:hypothetical protein
MARPTFLQKVLRRPSQKYATGASRTATSKAPQAQEQPHTRDFHSTKGELLRIASELNCEDPLDYNREDRRYLLDESCEFLQVSPSNHSPERIYIDPSVLAEERRGCPYRCNSIELWRTHSQCRYRR